MASQSQSDILIQEYACDRRMKRDPSQYLEEDIFFRKSKVV